MRSGDFARHDGEGFIMPPAPLDAVGVDEDRMRHAVPSRRRVPGNRGRRRRMATIDR
jgi:hypothetical protein